MHSSCLSLPLSPTFCQRVLLQNATFGDPALERINVFIPVNFLEFDLYLNAQLWISVFVFCSSYTFEIDVCSRSYQQGHLVLHPHRPMLTHQFYHVCCQWILHCQIQERLWSHHVYHIEVSIWKEIRIHRLSRLFYKLTFMIFTNLKPNEFLGTWPSWLVLEFLGCLKSFPDYLQTIKQNFNGNLDFCTICSFSISLR